MSTVIIYSFNAYKGYLKTRISEASREWGIITRLAQAANCQRSYLSRVLSTHVHLTLDQAFGLCEYWKLSRSESDYFLCLVEKERTGSKSYREYLESKLLSLKREYENIAQRVSRPKAETGEKEHLYYSAWYYTAIHMLVSIPAYQTVEAISKRLQLPEALIHSVLETLEQFGYVKKENRKWKYLGGEKHISKESPLVALHHNNWRQRAVIDAQSPLTRGLHFSVVQSMSREIHEELHQKLLQFIDEASRLAGPSREEELVAIGIDLFEV
jgi:uncharacterized protein (TIGR02147 family)